MSKQQHQIKKVIFDINVPSRDVAYGIQNQISSLFDKYLVEVTDRILSEYSLPEIVIKIDRLTLNLGNYTSNDLELLIQDYERELRILLKEKLGKAFYETNQNVTVEDTSNTELGILLFFLQTGRLPNETSNTLIINELFSKLITLYPNLIAERIRKLLNQEQVIRRLQYQINKRNLTAFFELYYPSIEHIHHHLTHNDFPNIPTQKLSTHLIDKTFDGLYQGLSEKKLSEFLQETTVKQFINIKSNNSSTDIDILHQFLIHGIFDDSNISFDTLWDNLFIHKNKPLKDLLNKLKQQNFVRERILNTFTETQLNQVIQLYIPESKQQFSTEALKINVFNILESTTPDKIKIRNKYTDLQVLQLYLEKGFFVKEAVDFEVFFQKLIENTGKFVRRLLVRIGDKTYVQQRLTEGISLVLQQRLFKLLAEQNPVLVIINALLKNIEISYKSLIIKSLKNDNIVSIVNDILNQIGYKTYVETVLEKVSGEWIKEFELIYEYLDKENLEQINEITPAVNALNLIHYFLQNGTIPWWYEEAILNFYELIKTIIQYNASSLAEIINKIGQKNIVQQRILEHFDDATLILLFNTLIPSYFGFIGTMTALLEEQFSKVEKWQPILQYYFNTINNFNPNTLTIYIVHFIASYKNHSITEVINYLLNWTIEQVKLGNYRFHPVQSILQQSLLNQDSLELSTSLKTTLSNKKIKDSKKKILDTKKEDETTTNKIKKDSYQDVENDLVENSDIELITVIGYYFQYGSIPASVDYSIKQIYQFVEQLISDNSISFKTLIEYLIQQKQPRERIVLLPNPIFSKLLSFIHPKSGKTLLKIITQLNGIVTETLLKSVALQVISKKSSQEIHRRFLHNLLQKVNQFANYSYDKGLEEIEKQLRKKTKLYKALMSLKKERTQIEEESKELFMPTDELIDDAIYIENAGLVMIWVFLTFLFKTLEFTQNNQFKSKESAIKAAYLLQYIATKSDEAPEFKLILNKILCGIPIIEPIPFVELSEEEKDGGEQLIKAVIQRWEKVKNTSVDGFRNSFLVRDGRLEESEKQWTLRVEQKPYDLLMSSLPWGIGYVKLPWMPKPIIVEWA